MVILHKKGIGLKVEFVDLCSEFLKDLSCAYTWTIV